jgi:hypothetical protein
LQANLKFVEKNTTVESKVTLEHIEELEKFGWLLSGPDNNKVEEWRNITLGKSKDCMKRYMSQRKSTAPAKKGKKTDVDMLKAMMAL